MPSAREERAKLTTIEWRKKNAERHKNNMRAWCAANPEKHLLSNARQRAKSKGLEYRLTVEDVKIPRVCPVLGIRLIRAAGYRGDASPSLDRIDNTKGYVSGNVCVISWRANALKRDSTIVELEKVVAYMRRHSAEV